jgi:hypothetical protein
VSFALHLLSYSHFLFRLAPLRPGPHHIYREAACSNPTCYRPSEGIQQVIEHAQSRKGNKTRPTWFGWPTAFHVFRPGGRTCTLLCLSADRSGAFLTRILIADDREFMRSALKLILAMRPSWKVCGEAEDGRDAITFEGPTRVQNLAFLRRFRVSHCYKGNRINGT